MARAPVILLHGWTMRGAVFEDLIARLSDAATCLAPDLAGHGTAAHLEPTLDAAAGQLAELVEISPAPPIVVGWSMGAAVAWRFVHHHGPDGLAGLMTVDMSPRITPSADWPHGLRNQTAEGLRDATCRMHTDWDGSVQAIAATMFAKGSDPRPFGRAEALEQILSEDPDKMRAVWADLMAQDARETVADVTCPWLIGYGARSSVYGEGVAQWLQAHAPNSELARFEHAGHSAHLEEPEAFAAALSEFIAAT